MNETHKKVCLTMFVIILVLVLYFYNQNNKEGFYTNFGYYKKYCPTCGWRSRNTCSKCTNCGYCINEKGVGQCVPGNSEGPFFSSNCVYWDYGDPYNYYPNSHLYPVIKSKDIYPYKRYHMRKPWNWKKWNKW